MISVGMLLRCKTTTKDDVFGTVLWEVVETGLQAPERERQDQKDGVKVVMLGGSGPKARAGFVVIDSEAHIERDIASGVTSVIPASDKDKLLKQYQPKGDGDQASARHGGSGVVEM